MGLRPGGAFGYPNAMLAKRFIPTLFSFDSQHDTIGASQNLFSKLTIFLFPVCLIYPEYTGLGEASLPIRRERFSESAPVLLSTAPAFAFPARSQRTASSAAVLREQGFALPTGAKHLLWFPYWLDWRAPFLSVSSFPVGKGWEA